VGGGVTVGVAAQIDGAVIFDDATVGAGAQVRDSVVGRGAVIGDGVVVDGVVVGDGATVESGNELRCGVRVFPGATLGSGAIRFSSDRS
jgi:mannose-1-phosphate guanylyltransferase